MPADAILSAEPLERDAPVMMGCVACGEPITLVPPVMPATVKKMLPLLLAALGAPMKKRDSRGDITEPTMFGLTGSELTALLMPYCYGCVLAQPGLRVQCADLPIVHQVTNG